MINPVLQNQLQVPTPISLAEISVVFLFAFVMVGGIVYIILARNRERWFDIRNVPFKKFIIDVPGNVLVRIIPKAGDTVELKILGKKRTYFAPPNASRDGKVYHYDFDNSNPKITPDRKTWKKPNQKEIDEKKLPVFRDYYTSEEISKLISNKSFGMYQRAKTALEVNNIILIMIGISIAVGIFGVYTMSQFIEDFPEQLNRALAPIINGGP